MKETYRQLYLLLLVCFSSLGVAEGPDQKVLDKYAEQIQRLNSDMGKAHRDLIEPYQSLSEVYFQQEDYVNAGSMLNTAIQLRRVNDGLFNESLLPHLERLSYIYLLSQRHSQADQIRKNISEIKLYRQDRSGLGAIPAHDQMASWYHDTDRYEKARAELRTITQIIRKKLGPDALELGPYLIRIAKTYLSTQVEIDPSSLRGSTDLSNLKAEQIHHRSYLTPAISALKRTQRLYDQNAADQMLDDRAKVNALLGDCYMVSDRPQQASAYYKIADDLLRSQEGYLANQLNFFATPKLIRFPKLIPNTARHTGDDAAKMANIEFSYTVTRLGRLANLKVNSINPPDVININRSQIARIARYRPVFSGNQLVDTHNVRHTFSYNFHTGESSSTITGESSPTITGESSSTIVQ